MNNTGQRLDIFLFRGRFFKTRGRATRLITQKGVSLVRDNMVRRIIKPSIPVLPEDILTFAHNKEVVSIKILALPERRGPTMEARRHYQWLNQKDSPDFAGHAKLAQAW